MSERKDQTVIHTDTIDSVDESMTNEELDELIGEVTELFRESACSVVLFAEVEGKSIVLSDGRLQPSGRMLVAGGILLGINHGVETHEDRVALTQMAERFMKDIDLANTSVRDKDNKIVTN